MLLMSLNDALESLGSQRHEFRNACQVPVRIGDLGVSEIGGQCEDLLPDIGSFLIPALKSAHAECMAGIVDTGPP